MTRNDHNLGAAPNFNKVFGLADSEYFKWAAHDDELQPGYLDACVRVLDREPSAALAHSWVEEIDDVGRVMRVYGPVSEQLASADPLTRFRSRVLERGWCTEIFGVIRTSKLRGSMLMASFAAADLSLIAELALRGPFIIMPEPLFRNRVHPSRYTNAIFENIGNSTRAQELTSWWDTSKKTGRWHANWWQFLFTLIPIVNRNVSSWRQRLRYYSVVFQWMLKRDNRHDLARDILFAISPGLHARRVQGTR